MTGFTRIPIALHGYGLTPAQFTLWCRIAMRGDCWESVPNMAKACHMTRNTAWTALKFLHASRMIIREPRIGRPTIFRTAPEEQWAESDPAQKEARVQKQPQLKKKPDTQRKRDADHPAQKEAHKLDSSELDSIKGGDSPPVASRNGEQMEGWKVASDKKTFLAEKQAARTPEEKAFWDKQLRELNEKIKVSGREAAPAKPARKVTRPTAPVSECPDAPGPMPGDDGWEEYKANL